jgi:uncharacterized iron-regulated protein
MPDITRRSCPPSVRAVLAIAFAAFLTGCAAPSIDARDGGAQDVARHLPSMLPTDILLIGEQHDAPDHHAIERTVVQMLAARSQLAAVAVEMAEEGRATRGLDTSATEEKVRDALRWDAKAWPWSDYGPVVMAAVRAGVPVVGANLPRARMKDAMADVSLDAQLSEPARRAQEEAVRAGHCDLLPPSQIGPMTRIQVARDRAMAQAVVKAREPGRTVLLIAGSAHADRQLGVPQHLPSDLKVRSVRLLAADVADEARGAYDATWRTPPLPARDYCAGVVRRTS